jgi:flavorubredoxin
MHPAMQHLCNEIKITAQKNKVVGLFGTSSWNGAGVKDLKKFAEENKIAPVEPAVETFGDPTPEKVEYQIDAFVKAYSSALK